MAAIKIELVENGFIVTKAVPFSAGNQPHPIHVFTNEETLFEYVRKWADDNRFDDEMLSNSTVKKLKEIGNG